MTDLCFLISFVANDGYVDKSFNLKLVDGDVFSKIMSKVGTGQKAKSKFLYDNCSSISNESLNHVVGRHNQGRMLGPIYNMSVGLHNNRLLEETQRV